jgi:glycosidase
VREFDVDGFRVDACWGVKQRRPDFWPQWRKELKRIKPDLLLLAEAGARDPYYFDNGFDVAYDWTDKLGNWAWQPVWDSYKLRMLNYTLTDALKNGHVGFHPDALLFRFLNNNDTGSRFITRHGEGVTRVATALLLTLPGVPCIYTGDELGAEFKPYENPEPLSWIEQVPGLRDYHKQHIDLRMSLPSLHSRQWTKVELEAARDQVAYGYLRFHDDKQDPLLVLLNFHEEPADLTFSLPEGFGALEEASALKDLLTDENVALEKVEAGYKVNMPGYGVRLLTAN